MTWTEQRQDDMHKPLYRNELGWTLYYWRGRGPQWVICRPDGRKWVANNVLKPDQTDEAKVWATTDITSLLRSVGKAA